MPSTLQLLTSLQGELHFLNPSTKVLGLTFIGPAWVTCVSLDQSGWPAMGWDKLIGQAWAMRLPLTLARRDGT